MHFALLAIWSAAAVVNPASAARTDRPDGPSSELARFIYPLAEARPAPAVVVDTTDAPDSEAWAASAKALVTAWFPEICRLLATDRFTPPREIKLVFKKELNVPAYSSGGVITISAHWVRDHPEDLGLVVHELTHTIQAYPRSRQTPGWLVEGIADFVRWWRYEPEAPRPRIDPAKASYRDSYRTTAAFLAWASHKFDERLVPRLDAALREKRDPLPVFDELAGKSIDDVWSDFVSTLPPRQSK